MNFKKINEKKETIENIEELGNKIVKALVKSIMIKILIKEKIQSKKTLILFEKSSIEKIFNDHFKPIFLSGEKNRNFKEKEIINFFFNMAVKENRKNNINEINDTFKNM